MMYAKTTTTLNENCMASPGRKLCMDCGQSMVEIDSCVENDIHFIWYKCTKCNGQWLHKESVSCFEYNKDAYYPTRL